MPHVIVKLWPGKSDAQKQALTDALTKAVMETLDYAEKSVSIGIEEIDSSAWREAVYQPDIVAKADTLSKKPGYSM